MIEIVVVIVVDAKMELVADVLVVAAVEFAA